MKYVHPNDASLLGSPIGDLSSINRAIEEKLDILKIIGQRLSKFSTHDALVLLKHAFAIPKILYILRTAPSFISPALKDFDSHLRSLLSEVINVDLSDDMTWLQASLPVRSGGIGIRSAIQLAPSAYLASAAGCKDIIYHLIPPFSACSFVDLALQDWSTGHNHSPPLGTDAIKQKSWDKPRVDSCKTLLLDSAEDSQNRARLLASFCKESGYWLEAPPISSLGLRLDDTVIRIAVGLRLGAPLCRPHNCEQCGTTVDEPATHGLHCKKSQGRHSRHSAVNDIIHRALLSAGIPSRLEPKGTNPSDGSRPDGVSLVPWKRGRPITWDFTCPDTFAPSHLPHSSVESGAVAADAENSKALKYSHLSNTSHFIPVAVETTGTFGPSALAFLHEIGRRIKIQTGDQSSTYYLLQHISIAIQRGNVESVLGTMSHSSANSPLFF